MLAGGSGTSTYAIYFSLLMLYCEARCIKCLEPAGGLVYIEMMRDVIHVFSNRHHLMRPVVRLLEQEFRQLLGSEEESLRVRLWDAGVKLLSIDSGS